MKLAFILKHAQFGQSSLQRLEISLI